LLQALKTDRYERLRKFSERTDISIAKVLGKAIDLYLDREGAAILRAMKNGENG